jgi:hypothetical protein
VKKQILSAAILALAFSAIAPASAETSNTTIADRDCIYNNMSAQDREKFGKSYFTMEDATNVRADLMRPAWKLCIENGQIERAQSKAAVAAAFNRLDLETAISELKSQGVKIDDVISWFNAQPSRIKLGMHPRGGLTNEEFDNSWGSMDTYLEKRKSKEALKADLDIMSSFITSLSGEERLKAGLPLN